MGILFCSIFRTAALQGATVRFAVQGGTGATVSQGATLEVYTTRPDTLFGATYMVVAPEHPMLAQLTTEEHRCVWSSLPAGAL